MDDDILQGQTYEKLTLNEPSFESKLFLLLPSPIDKYGEYDDEIVIVASIFDSLTGMQNISLPIKVTHLFSMLDERINFKKDFIDFIEKELSLDEKIP